MDAATCPARPLSTCSAWAWHVPHSQTQHQRAQLEAQGCRSYRTSFLRPLVRDSDDLVPPLQARSLACRGQFIAQLRTSLPRGCVLLKATVRRSSHPRTTNVHSPAAQVRGCAGGDKAHAHVRTHGRTSRGDGVHLRAPTPRLHSSLSFLTLGAPISWHRGSKGKAMSAASPQALPLAPRSYLNNTRSVHVRYHTWYHILVSKLHLLCRNGRGPFKDVSGPGKAVKTSLEAWQKAFKLQFSQIWVYTLTEKQLEDIFLELYSLAEYLFALNVRRSRREIVATVGTAIKETVRTSIHHSLLSRHTEYLCLMLCFSSGQLAVTPKALRQYLNETKVWPVSLLVFNGLTPTGVTQTAESGPERLSRLADLSLLLLLNLHVKGLPAS